jgi:adenosylhomocysteine nucleosidase
MRIGIIGAMQQEIAVLLNELQQTQCIEKGGRKFYEGILYEKEVVLVFSRWGKVAAATTATQLILDFKVDLIIFTGVAGALSRDIHVGDVVVGSRLYQHDMDARPLMPRFEIPLLRRSFFESDAVYSQKATQAINDVFKNDLEFRQKLTDFGITSPIVMVGDVASGDKFVSSAKDKKEILTSLPSVACVEMEGASVAQVCYDFSLPVLVIRTISDEADEKAEGNFMSFLTTIAPEYPHHIFKKLFRLL